MKELEETTNVSFKYINITITLVRSLSLSTRVNYLSMF